MFQADLLISLERMQGALASMQHAEALADTEKQFPFIQEEVLKVLPKGWYLSLTAPEAIDLRMGVLHEMVGDSEAALSYLEKALSQQPGSAQIRFLTVDLADALLYREKSAAILLDGDRYAAMENERLDALCEMEKQANSWFVCDACCFETRQRGILLIQSSAMIEKGLRFDEDQPSLLALKSRNMARKGEREAADEQYRKAIRRYGQLKEAKKSGTTPVAARYRCTTGVSILNRCPGFGSGICFGKLG